MSAHLSISADLIKKVLSLGGKNVGFPNTSHLLSPVKRWNFEKFMFLTDWTDSGKVSDLSKIGNLFWLKTSINNLSIQQLLKNIWLVRTLEDAGLIFGLNTFTETFDGFKYREVKLFFENTDTAETPRSSFKKGKREKGKKIELQENFENYMIFTGLKLQTSSH